MKGTRLATPWNRNAQLYTAPGRVVVKLRLGEAPEAIPAALDVRRGASEPPPGTGVRAVDRVLGHFSSDVRVARVHTAAAAAARAVPGRAHVGFDDVEHAIGLSRTFRVHTERQCHIDDVVDALRQIHEVEWASPQYLCSTPFAVATAERDPQAPDTTLDTERAWLSREQVGAVAAMAYEAGDAAVVIALVDTGVEATHPELGPNLRTGLDTVQLGRGDLAAGMQLLGDTTSVDTDPEDEVGHGTSCAAIIGGVGLRLPPGVAAGCGLVPARVLGSAGYRGRSDRIGVGSIADIDSGLKWAIDLGAKVLNMSFGTPEEALRPNDPVPHADVVRYAMERGCVLVAASGNSGKEERFTPASLDGVIAVGSVGDDDRPSSFSTRGAHVALSAPGERVASAGLNGYSLVTGTSFAAPFVSAAAALLVSRANRRAYPVDVADVRRFLCATARPFPSGTDAGGGAGVLDVHAALVALDHHIDRGPPAEESPMAS